MAHQQQNYNGRPPARGPAPRGYQQPQYGYSQYGYSYQQPPSRGYAAYNAYGAYPPQQSYTPYTYQQTRAYTGGYQRSSQPNQQTTGKPKPAFVPRKKNLLVIQKPDGTVVEGPQQKKDTPASVNGDTTASPPKSNAPTESAAKSATAVELTVEATGTVNPTPEPVAVANPEPVAVAKPEPVEPKPVEVPALPTEVKSAAKVEAAEPNKPSPLAIDEVDEAPDCQPGAGAEKTFVKPKLDLVQTSDLDDWDNADIQTPGSIKTPHIPHDKAYSIEMLKKIRDSCNLEPLKAWPALEIIKAVSTPRVRESPRGGPRQRRNYQDGPRHDQRRNAPRQWARGQQIPQQTPRQSPRDSPRPQIQLHKTKNKWSRDKHEQSKSKDHLELVKKGANLILNKISVDNFERMLPKFLELDIQTKGQFEAVTEIIFDKALRMPTYCHLYAKLCGEVNQKAKMFCDKIVKIVEEEEDDRKVYYYDVGDDVRTEGVEGPYEQSDVALTKGTKACTFKRVLLNQCQRVFESHSSWEEAFNKANDPSLSETAKKKMLAEAEETRFKVKQRSLGIVQFVAHLFLNSLLSEKRVHVCMSELLQRCEKELNQPSPNTEGVEVFTRIITEVGQTIDNGPNRDIIDLYIQNLKKISKTKGLDSRTKFLIMDVIDLRQKYNWVPRRKQAKQVTKAQFKKDADAKMRETNRKNQRRGGSNSRRHNDRRGGDRFRR